VAGNPFEGLAVWLKRSVRVEKGGRITGKRRFLKLFEVCAV
jgi:hypothetical protein